MKHPFVSSYSRGFGASGNNVCMGEMMDDIIRCFLKLDWTSMSYWIDTWLTTYKVGVTGPLNDIKYCILGKQTILSNKKDVSEDYYDIIPHMSTEGCWQAQANAHRAQNDFNEAGMTLDPNEIVSQCDEMKCQLRSTCEGYQANTFDLALQQKLDEYVSNNCSFETLLPSDQEYEEEYIYYSNLISDSIYSNRNTRIPWELMTNAIQNKAFLMVGKLIEFMWREGIVSVYDDDLIHEDTINIIINGESHESICRQLVNLYGEPTKVTDEQSDMLDWAAAMRQQ